MKKHKKQPQPHKDDMADSITQGLFILMMVLVLMFAIQYILHLPI